MVPGAAKAKGIPLILLVEDQHISALWIKKVLENAGFSVIHADKGEDAVKIVMERGDLDLVLMDIDLGEGMCGLKASHIINSIDSLPIVFYTGRDKKEVESILYLGDFSYIPKTSPAGIIIETIISKLDTDGKNFPPF